MASKESEPPKQRISAESRYIDISKPAHEGYWHDNACTTKTQLHLLSESLT